MGKSVFGFADLFAIPVSLFKTRRKEFVGSFLGFLLSMLLLISIFGYVYNKYHNMYNFEYDKYSS